MRKYSIYLSRDMIEKYIFSDFNKDERTIVNYGLFRTEGRLYVKAREISYKEKLSFFDSVYLFGFSLLFCKLPFSRGKSYFFTNVSLLGISPIYLKLFFLLRLRKKAFFIMIDNLNKKHGWHALRCIKLFNFKNVFSYDKKDASTYGLKYCTFYSKQPIYCNVVDNYDLFYIGWLTEGRLELVEMVNRAVRNKAEALLMIGCGMDIQRDCIHFFSGVVDYSRVLEYVSKANCILDLVQESVSGVSMRYCEALIYNKKLLSNNDEIIKMPYYDPKYMKVFHKLEDIDLEWIKKRENIDYKYNDDFSPIKFVNEIEKYFSFEKQR